jgi:methionyl-tRNA formyltransferase
MRLVFMGTPAFAAETLRALMEAGHCITCVYSQPPRPAGRGYHLQKSPVQLIAETHGIVVKTPVSLKSPQEQEAFAALKTDAAVVVAYGLILPKAILDAPKHGCFNVHASLLPRWRGAAPIQRAIMAGDKQSGVTIMRMEPGLDTGPILRSVGMPVDDETTYASLHDALAAEGAKAMVEVLAEAHSKQGVAQQEDDATYAKKIEKAETHIDFTKTAQEVIRHIHGLSPFPGAWTIINGSRVKILRVDRSVDDGEAGCFLDDALAIACGSGSLRLTQLQREGKGAMDAATFLRGFPVSAGTRAT